MSRPQCPQCGKLLVSPAGMRSSEILLVGEFPGVEEIKVGVPFVGRTGEVLSYELARVGIQLRSCFMTNLWLHQMDKDCSIDYHIGQLTRLMPAFKYILLMGSETSKTLLRRGIMEVSGLVVQSPLIPSTSIAVASPNPASAFKKGSTVGELRHAIQIFKEQIDAN